MKKWLLLFVNILVFISLNNAQTLTDYDGNVYNTLTIGNQVWMKENLKTTHYADGTTIPLVNTKSSWDALTLTDKAYCWYNDADSNKIKYGALYTWAAAMHGASSSSSVPSGIQGVCPNGWHFPSDDEWTNLTIYLQNNDFNYNGVVDTDSDWNSNNKIAKSLGALTGWNKTTVIGSVGNNDYSAYRNKSGFTALPAGSRFNDGSFINEGYSCAWWSSTDYYTNYAHARSLEATDVSMQYLFSPCFDGRSVRCIKGFSVSIEEKKAKDLKGSFIIYPNPANDFIIVDNLTSGECLDFYNSLGNIVLRKHLHLSKEEVDISSLPAGIYFIKIKDGSRLIQQKFVKK